VEKTNDTESAEVITAIMQQLPSTGSSSELQEKQVLELADLRAQQMKEERLMEQQLDKELYLKEREVVQQLEEQKKLVSDVSDVPRGK